MWQRAAPGNAFQSRSGGRVGAIAWTGGRHEDISPGTWPAFDRFGGHPEAGIVVAWLVITLVNGFGEETGWRGFLLPQLHERLAPLAATLPLAVIRALWHLPVVYLLESFEQFSLPLLGGWLVGPGCGAVVLTWLHNRSGGVLLVAVWHGTYNMVPGTEGVEGTVQVVVSALMIALAMHLVVQEWRSRRTGGAGALGP